MKMKTILWLDDNEELIDASAEIFREYDFKIVKATNTSRALTILREQQLDGFLLDVRLRGGESGLEFLEEVRQRYPTLQVVVFTGFPHGYDQTIAKRLGASSYLEKIRKLIPVEPEEQRKFFAALHQIFDRGPNRFETTEFPTIKQISVFCSYSHRDAKLKDRLEEHLAPLKRSGMVSIWHDRKIGAGKEWMGEIDAHLGTSDIVLLLVSASFMASDYCNDVEVRRAMERHDTHETRVIPVILRPADWRSAPFSKLQALPINARPLTQWADREEGFFSIAQEIRSAIEEISQLRSPKRDS
jgi:CheY-like chemotaxis protein